MRIAYHLGGAASGLALLAVTESGVRRLPPGRRVPAYAALLPVAAAVYPVLRRGGRLGVSGRTELLALAAYSTATMTATHTKQGTRRRLVAAGWASHAVFDLVHHRDEGSLVPDWYPAACLAYDLALAALIAGARES